MAWFALAKRLTLPFARPLPRPFTGKCWAASSGFWKCLFRLRTQTESLESDKPNVYRVIAKVGAVLLRKIQKFNHREPFSVWPLWSSSVLISLQVYGSEQQTQFTLESAWTDYQVDPGNQHTTSFFKLNQPIETASWASTLSQQLGPASSLNGWPTPKVNERIVRH